MRTKDFGKATIHKIFIWTSDLINENLDIGRPPKNRRQKQPLEVPFKKKHS